MRLHRVRRSDQERPDRNICRLENRVEIWGQRRWFCRGGVAGMLLVIGPSSVGKSTFINSPMISELGYVSPDQPIHMSKKGQIKKGKPVPPNSVLHWNYFAGSSRLEGLSLLDDENVGPIDRAVVLVAPIAELEERAAVRTTGEKGRGEYNSEHWLSKIKGTDFFQAYEDLFDHFDERGIKYDVLFSSKEHSQQFVKSDRVFVHHNLRGKFVKPPTQAEIQNLLNERIPYQNIIVPGNTKAGRKTANRQATFRQIFSGSLQGRSVLDIGCALGEFLFTAERRGAERLVGVEADDARYSIATSVGKLSGSAVGFHNIPFQEFESGERFDYVLLLNVIHHIADFRSMLLKAAGLTNQRLVVEFPTLHDRKFLSITDVDPVSIPDHLPLVGVSSKSVGQRFVFTPAAIKRICLEETKLFSSCEVFESPKPGRLIAVFDRGKEQRERRPRASRRTKADVPHNGHLVTL